MRLPAGVPGFDPGALRRARARAGLSQTALAQLVGAPQQRVSEWEHGTKTPTAPVLPRLATALGIPTVQLTRHRSRPSLRQLRVLAGHTQGSLAAAAGVPRHAYARLERGQRPASPELLDALARVLELDRETVEVATARSLRQR